MLPVALGVGFGLGVFVYYPERLEMVRDTIALSWSDGTEFQGGPGLQGFYGAHVVGRETAEGFEVSCHVHIGPPDGWVSYEHDCGVLGVVESRAVAVERWGTIQWTEDAVWIGDPARDGVSVPRKTLQQHR